MPGIKPIERVKSRVIRVSLKCFMAEPSLGNCQAKALLEEVQAYLKDGSMDDEQVVQTVVNNHATGAPKGQLSLM